MNSKKALFILITLVTVGSLLPLLAEPAPVSSKASESFIPGQTVGGGDVFLPVLSNPPIEQWIRNYPISQNSYTSFIDKMVFAPNGDIVWVGHGSDGQDFTALMGRVQTDGELLWIKGYGNAEPYHDSFSAIVPASAGGYWIGGSTRIDNVQKDYPWLLRVNEEGTILWQKIVMPPTPSPYGAKINQIIETDNNGLVVIINDFYFGVWITKLAEDGTVSWVRNFGTMYDNRSITHIAIDNDDHYVMAGAATGADGSLTWVVKMSSGGELLWQHLYALSQAATRTGDDPFGLAILNNGNILVGIRTELTIQGQPNRSFWFVRLNGNGDVVWQKSWQNAPMDIPNMAVTPEQDIVVTGREFYLGNTRPWVFRVSSTGALSWRYFYGGINEFLWPAAALAVQVSDAGDIYVGGSESYQFDAGVMLMRLSSQGIVPDCDLFTLEPLSSATPGYHVETPAQLPVNSTLTVTNVTIPTWNLVGQTVEICPVAGRNMACDLPE